MQWRLDLRLEHRSYKLKTYSALWQSQGACFGGAAGSVGTWITVEHDLATAIITRLTRTGRSSLYFVLQTRTGTALCRAYCGIPRQSLKGHLCTSTTSYTPSRRFFMPWAYCCAKVSAGVSSMMPYSRSRLSTCCSAP